MTIVEVDLETREVVRRVGMFATFADAYGFMQTQLGRHIPELPELNIHKRAIIRLPGGERAFVIQQEVAA